MSGKTLLALAEGCEKASGPDRELDALIAAAIRICHKDWRWADSYPAWEGRADGRVYLERGGPSFEAPAYTASLDAAMTLVPEGWDWQAASHGEDGAYAAVWTHGYHDDTVIHVHSADTPALALCAAALRARAHTQETSHVG